MAVPGQLWVPPLDKNDPLIFIDESQNPEKSEIITFEAFWAKNAKNVNFDTFCQKWTWFLLVSRSTISKFVKNTHFQTFSTISLPTAVAIWALWHKINHIKPGLIWKYPQKWQITQNLTIQCRFNHTFDSHWKHLIPPNSAISLSPKYAFSIPSDTKTIKILQNHSNLSPTPQISKIWHIWAKSKSNHLTNMQ